MKTIAITIDDDTLNALEAVAKELPRRARSRSRLIRMAIKEFVVRQHKEAREAREREVFKKHRAKLARQAKALISDQAKV